VSCALFFQNLEDLCFDNTIVGEVDLLLIHSMDKLVFIKDFYSLSYLFDDKGHYYFYLCPELVWLFEIINDELDELDLYQYFSDEREC
jgi:hypothetical protein